MVYELYEFQPKKKKKRTDICHISERQNNQLVGLLSREQTLYCQNDN